MTTATAQHQDISAKRAPMPPVEKDMPVVATGGDEEEPVNAPSNEQAPVVTSPPVHEAAHAPANATQPPAKQPEQGNWFARNRWFTKEPITYAGYQFFRSAMATIPYGFAMAAVHHAFGYLAHLGVKMGLTKEGYETYYKAWENIPNPHIGTKGGPGGAAKAVDVFGAAEREALHAPGFKGVFGRNLARFASSPINQALQIGLAFSMFRFVGSLIKGQRDKVMDEKNTPEDTNRETKNWWQNTKELMHVNWKAEATGTFWAALTLGFIGALAQHTTPYRRLSGETFTQAVKRAWDKPAKLLQNAAIWAISYSAFFEVDERIQKDWKLREGTWKGHSNSLLNKPDATITGQPPQPGMDADDQPKTTFASFTQDPSLARVVFRRLLPVAAGISVYAAAKRVGYIAAGGRMMPIGRNITEGSLKTNVDRFLTNSWREGLATATFGVLWMATDAWGSWYDKFFENLQHKDNQKPVTEHQHQKYSELLDRVNAKEQGAGRAA